jgi:hypothetical protein
MWIPLSLLDNDSIKTMPRERMHTRNNKSVPATLIILQLHVFYDRIIGGHWIGKGMEGSSRGLLCGYILIFTLKC